MLRRAEKISWDELLEEYFRSHMLRPTTKRSYDEVKRGFVNFMGETMLPEEVTHRDVLRWRCYLLGQKKQSVHSWNNKVVHLWAIFNFGIEKRLLPNSQNPFNGVTGKK
ncbi:phage integrase SAM-like domain-containing protein [Xenorhabdus sp. 18]|uniref:phage integrase SAM-like domain-containing protein n=1 Tax=Xenorhabdus doucetiae TaxID=351671 RepID=UPI001985B17B|nr:phage integrase SAM-like domain-containing protein [Xenorhabdus sp. 18]MBD2798423.1 phage integrase SAM-like domain-containing protein [Xenorhabdus sp. 18]